MTRALYMTGAALVLALVLASGPTAQAWAPIHPSQPVWCGPVPYGLGQVSDDLGDATTLAEVRRGIDDWTRVACTSVQTQWNGRLSSRAGAQDGVSMIGWVEAGWPHDPNALGVTAPRFDSSGCMREADIQMNGDDYTWTTSPGRGSVANAYSIILHEGGHYLGLGHSQDQRATMFFAYQGGVSSLNADDRAGVCSLYPGDGEPADCTDTGCPDGQVCVDGRCDTATGDGNVCSPCRSGADCGGRNDFCLQYPSGAAFCGRQCFGGDCGPSEQCVPVSGVGQCVRVAGDGQTPSCESRGGTAPQGCRTTSDCDPGERCNAATGECEPESDTGLGLGEPCGEAADCASGLCLPTPSGSVCSRSCDWLRPAGCPSEFYCDGDATGTCGTGVCLAGSAGRASLGEACEADTECASLFCDGVCAEPCIPGGAAGCPDGFQCQQSASPGCGSCKSASRLGEPCEVNEDCISRFCAARGGETFCTDLCSSEEDCPAGFSCDPAGDVSVCAPPATGPRPRETGFPCANNGDCNSGLCAETADGRTFCTAVCGGEGDCPEGFSCQPTAGDESVCAPDGSASGDGMTGRGGGGCTVSGAAPGSPWGALGLLGGVLAVLVRRRRTVR